jgi:outer membrane protein TolC
MKKRLLSFAVLILSCNYICVSQIILYKASDAVNIGLQNTEEYKIERLQALAGIKISKVAIGGFLPSFSFGITESDGKKINANDSRTKSIQFGITQTIFNGGKTKLSYDMSKLSATFQYYAYEQNIRAFSVTVIHYFFNYITQLKQIEVKKNLLNNAQEQLNIIKAEYERGMILASDYLEYEISVMKKKNELKQMERNLRSSFRAFKVLIGLPLEAELIIVNAEELNEEEDFFLEPFTDYIVSIVKNSNMELQQQRISLDYSKKQLELSRLYYVPSISLESNVSFSGEKYPLTEPNYSVKLGLSFLDLPNMPFSFSEGYGLDNKGFNSISNAVNGNLKPNFTFRLNSKNADLTLKKNLLDYKTKEQSLKEDVLTKIASHDDCLDNIKIIKETLILQEKRLTVCKAEVERGDKKRLDYLEDLEEYAEQLIELSKAQNNLLSSWYELELLTNIPLGELKNVCLSSTN